MTKSNNISNNQESEFLPYTLGEKYFPDTAFHAYRLAYFSNRPLNDTRDPFVGLSEQSNLYKFILAIKATSERESNKVIELLGQWENGDECSWFSQDMRYLLCWALKYCGELSRSKTVLSRMLRDLNRLALERPITIDNEIWQTAIALLRANYLSILGWIFLEYFQPSNAIHLSKKIIKTAKIFNDDILHGKGLALAANGYYCRRDFGAASRLMQINYELAKKMKVHNVNQILSRFAFFSALAGHYEEALAVLSRIENFGSWESLIKIYSLFHMGLLEIAGGEANAFLSLPDAKSGDCDFCLEVADVLYQLKIEKAFEFYKLALSKIKVILEKPHFDFHHFVPDYLEFRINRLIPMLSFDLSDETLKELSFPQLGLGFYGSAYSGNISHFTLIPDEVGEKIIIISKHKNKTEQFVLPVDWEPFIRRALSLQRSYHTTPEIAEWFSTFRKMLHYSIQSNDEIVFIQTFGILNLIPLSVFRGDKKCARVFHSNFETFSSLNTNRINFLIDPNGDLPFASKEEELCHEFLGEKTINVIKQNECTVATFTDTIQKGGFIHYAGHTKGRGEDPAEIGFILSDGFLSINRLSEMKAGQGTILLLASCEGAAGNSQFVHRKRTIVQTLGGAGVLAIIAAVARIPDEGSYYQNLKLFYRLFSSSAADPEKNITTVEITEIFFASGLGNSGFEISVFG